MNNSSYSQQDARPLTVPNESRHKNHQVTKKSDNRLISRIANFPSHYTPVPPIGHKEGGKQRNKTPLNSARRNKGKRRNFDEVLSYLDSVIVNEWLEECNKAINRLNIFAMNYKMAIGFFNFLLDEMKFEEYCSLLDMEYSIISDRLKYGFHAGFTINQLNDNDISQLVTAVLPEYPERFKRRDENKMECGVENLLNIFMVLSSTDKTDDYRNLLKKLNCITQNKQHVQWLLAIRAHGLISFVSGILRFYENMSGKSADDSRVRPNLVQKECLTKGLVCYSITAGKLKVLDYLNRNCSSLDGMLDERGRNLLFLAIESGEDSIVYYLCQVSKEMF